MILVEGESLEKVGLKLKSLGEYYSKNGFKVGLLITDEIKEFFEREDNIYHISLLGSMERLEEVARNLYESLRKQDEKGVDIILAQGFKERGMGLTISNRLKKAASNKIIKV